jgi:DHA1 family tetracycline resistance protein-like MFS transporter
MKVSNKQQLRILSAIIILDLLSATMTVPLFPIIITDPELSILGTEVSLGYKYWSLTVLWVTYAFAQLIGAPFFGGLSDKYGRKKLLAVIFSLNIVQYIAIGISIYLNSYWLLLISRTLSGFAGGTVFIQQSAIADLSTKEDKAKNLGIVGVAFGFGLIFGPIMGTWLADPNNHPSFSLATPFLAILVINTLTLVLLYFSFKESLVTFNKKPISIFSGFKNLYSAFSVPNWRVLFLTTTFVCAGLYFFLQFFQVMLEAKFNFGLMEQGMTLAYCGLIMVVAQGVLLPKMTKYYSVERLLIVFIPTMSVGYMLLSYAETIPFLIFALTVMVIAQGVCTPGILSLISNKADRDIQGSTIGINQSIQSFASAIPAIFATSFVAQNIKFPLVFGAIMSFIAFIVYYFFEYRPNHKKA